MFCGIICGIVGAATNVPIMGMAAAGIGSSVAGGGGSMLVLLSVLLSGGNRGDGEFRRTLGTLAPVTDAAANGEEGDGDDEVEKDEKVGAELHTGRLPLAPIDPDGGIPMPADDKAGGGEDVKDDLPGRLIVLPLRVLAPLATGSGSATVTTRKREFDGKNNVGELPVDEGDGEVEAAPSNPLLPPLPLPVESVTRDTRKRLRDGLGTGDAMGDGMGLGNGERKRPLGFLHPPGPLLPPPLGSSRCCLSASALGEVRID